MACWEATTLAKTDPSALRTAAAVSSQDVSMPRMGPDSGKSGMLEVIRFYKKKQRDPCPK
jgi:hypothetical protein